MNKRKLAGMNVTEIGLGTWQLGTKWGDPFDAKEARSILEASLENGINVIDTADVYNDNLSEIAIGEFLQDHKNDEIYVLTKCGRALDPHVSEGYNAQNIRRFTEASLKRLKVDALDLIQLHCPPTDVYAKEEVYEELRALKAEGKIKNYGVSIEKVEEGIEAMKHGISSIQVIFNMFRLKPAELLFEEAKKNDVGLIVRVPLASGLLTGKFSKDTKFSAGDHRFYNRNGESFDKGETFSGVDYETGLNAVEALKELFPDEKLHLIALRYILMYDAVSTVIPGASRTEQVVSNVSAASLAPLTEAQMQGVKDIYDKYIRKSVHPLW
ncbi:MAG: aldo/keto reductase [Christensenellaceae bacterium]|nr:aldo/keto reductase [Christensenellaceae bacterium]